MTSSHQVFDQLVASQHSNMTANTGRIITTAEWHEWQQQVVLDILQGQRYGQSFCNYFGITDNILYYERSQVDADRYIGFNYR